MNVVSAMVNRLHTALRNQLWDAVVTALGRELENVYDEITLKKSLYDIKTMDYARLREVSALLGVTFDASIDDSVEFLRDEVRAIPFKIQNKSTVLLYRSFFRSLGRAGEISIYFFLSSSDAIVRSMRDPIPFLQSHDPTVPFRHNSLDEFTGFLEDTLRLDTGLNLDTAIEEDIWTLDTVDTQISTNHIAMEFVIDRLIEKQVRLEDNSLVTKEFLITWEYMDFVQVNVDFSRRVKEVPHVGCQVYAIVDESHIVNPHGGDYTIAPIKMKAITLPAAEALPSALALAYIEFGVGSQSIPMSGDPATYPTELETRVARNFIRVDEKWEGGDWIAASAQYRGQEINRFVLHTGTGYSLNDDYGTAFNDATDGTNTTFRGTLPFAPIQPRNIQFNFISGGLTFLATDNGQGGLEGPNASGTVDYQTGQYALLTDFTRYRDELVITGDGEIDSITESYDLDYDIDTNSVTVRYNIGDFWYFASDDGTGGIAGDFISAGSVDYATGIISIQFTQPITEGRDVRFRFTHRVVTVPDLNSEVRADFFFTVRTIEITEAALYDEGDNMIAYATFPPLEFNNARNHVSFGFAYYRGLF